MADMPPGLAAAAAKRKGAMAGGGSKTAPSASKPCASCGCTGSGHPKASGDKPPFMK